MARGHRRRVGVALAVVLVLGVAGAGIAWSAWREDPYDHALVRYDDERGEPNRYTNLDDGAAQLAVGSPDGHRLVVQWRDPDGHGWTAPRTVWTDERNVAIESTVRYGGGTVAIVETYTPDTSKDNDIGDVHVAVVCRELACAAAEGPAIATEAQVTPDGEVVYLGEDDRGVRLWTATAGFGRADWSGHPGRDDRRVSPSRPVLAPDGSLRVVVTRSGPGSCTFQLLTSPPASAALTPAAQHTQRLRRPAASDCQVYLDTLSPDWLAVHSYDHRASDFWFVRRGDTWSSTRQDPSGLEPIDRPGEACCDTGVVGFVHWNDVAYGSPDGRRLQVQTHLLGEERWGAPQLLDGAPAGYTCTWLDGSDLGDGFLLVMTCHEDGSRVRDPYSGDAYAVAATTDLEHWETAWVADAPNGPVVDHDGLRVEDLTWTAEDGFERGG